ncbi:MAG: nucleotidyltransferase domain-containing protein [Oscillospiraceae bacterium]|nr:nucleotidyltransferase domain-containing protein [Oscillospiraceae bacterium]
MLYTINELRQKIKPIAVKYNLPVVYVFGSYARNEATDDSDLDILIDKNGSKVKSLFDMSRLHNELCEIFKKEVDLITTYALSQDNENGKEPLFRERVMQERIAIYD